MKILTKDFKKYQKSICCKAVRREFCVSEAGRSALTGLAYLKHLVVNLAKASNGFQNILALKILESPANPIKVWMPGWRYPPLELVTCSCVFSPRSEFPQSTP